MANPLRIEGPDPPAMICRDIERWLIAAFETLPEAPIYSPRAGVTAPLYPNIAPQPLELLAFSVRVLGLDSAERMALLTWARSMARRRIKRHRRLRMLKDVPGGTISDHCREFGLCRRTFDRRRKRACHRLADAWNAKVTGKPE